jgi:peptidoglycan/xylan/chitin deacetylase (PgdA/CDA1 family)
MLRVFKNGLIFFIVASRLYSAIRFLRVTIFRFPCIAVLCYHHIGKSSNLVAPYATPVSYFEKHVLDFVKLFSIATVSGVLDFLHKRKGIITDELVFSFDDGYLDNAVYAAPILEKNGVQGLFFVTTESLHRNALLWNDRVALVLEYVRKNKCVIDDSSLAGDLVHALSGFITATESEMLVASQVVFRWFYEQEQSIRESTLKQFEKIVPDRLVGSDNSRTLMNKDHLLDLVKSGHEIGAHTVTHTRLSRAGHNLQSEIADSISGLRNAGIPITSFAYPFGRKTDISSEMTDILQKENIGCAFTAIDDIISNNAQHHLLLPRIMVGSWHTSPYILMRIEWFAWRQFFVQLFHRSVSQ